MSPLTAKIGTEHDPCRVSAAAWLEQISPGYALAIGSDSMMSNLLI
jgi:hypothetical protein